MTMYDATVKNASRNSLAACFHPENMFEIGPLYMSCQFLSFFSVVHIEYLPAYDGDYGEPFSGDLSVNLRRASYIMQVTLQRGHFVALVMERVSGRFIVMDSIAREDKAEDVYNSRVEKFLVDYRYYANLSDLLTEARNRPYGLVTDLPRQTDNVSCGAYAIYFLAMVMCTKSSMEQLFSSVTETTFIHSGFFPEMLSIEEEHYLRRWIYCIFKLGSYQRTCAQRIKQKFNQEQGSKYSEEMSMLDLMNIE